MLNQLGRPAWECPLLCYAQGEAGLSDAQLRLVAPPYQISNGLQRQPLNTQVREWGHSRLVSCWVSRAAVAPCAPWLPNPPGPDLLPSPRLLLQATSVLASHMEGTLEYDAHNLFGHAQALRTSEAARAATGQRPFVLSRSGWWEGLGGGRAGGGPCLAARDALTAHVELAQISSRCLRAWPVLDTGELGCGEWHRAPPLLLARRSTFVGTGAFAAHWTGDNLSDWPDMAWSIAGIINSGLAGIPFGGCVALQAASCIVRPARPACAIGSTLPMLLRPAMANQCTGALGCAAQPGPMFAAF